MTRDLPRSGRIGVCVSILFLGLISVRSLAADAKDIVWHDDIAIAETEAKTKSRPIWIQFTGPWCHYCRRMDRETFKDPKVTESARAHFVTLKLRSDVHERLALSYGLNSLPATVIVKPTGEVIAKREGFADPSEFCVFLNEALIRDGRARDRAPTTIEPNATGDGIALAGCCPVSLVVNRRLVSGQPAFSLVHEGRIYRFANESDLKLFKRQPARFIPVNDGRCPVAGVDRGESRPGTPRCGAIYQGHLYLCADESSQRSFLKNPARYAHVDVADRGFCPHCWGRDQLLVRGRPNLSITRGGQIYMFPDLNHLSAFRASSDRTRR